MATTDKLGKYLNERKINLKYIDDRNHTFPELNQKAIITNDDTFTKNLLTGAGFNNLHLVRDATQKRAEEIKKQIKEKDIAGFGGGKALDIAKKISSDLNLGLTLVPTAPSHDGLASKNCSLYNGHTRETIPAKYPEEIIIPLHLWKNSGSLKKAGICDLFSNLVALQDISLAETQGAQFSTPYKNLSLWAVKKIETDGSDKALAEALIASGIAMEETSSYCSGSEHEVERLLETTINSGKYLHGQLAGTGTLVSAKVYSAYSSALPHLLFESRNLFEDIKNKMEKKGVYDFALEALKDSRFRPDCLKKVREIRPQRYTLWNLIDSEKIDWEKTISEILDS